MGRTISRRKDGTVGGLIKLFIVVEKKIAILVSINGGVIEIDIIGAGEPGPIGGCAIGAILHRLESRHGLMRISCVWVPTKIG